MDKSNLAGRCVLGGHLVLAFVAGLCFRDVWPYARPVDSPSPAKAGTSGRLGADTSSDVPHSALLVDDEPELSAASDLFEYPAVPDPGSSPVLGSQPATLDDRLETIAGLMSESTPRNQQQLAVEMQGLLSMIDSDPAIRQSLIKRLSDSMPNEQKNLLFSIIAASNHADINQEALRMSEQGTTEERLTGLQLLAESPAQSMDIRQSIMDRLKTGAVEDDAITVAALSALTRRGAVASTEQQRVIEVVKPYARNTNPHIREQAIRILGEWAPNDPTVVQAMISATTDSELGVRIGAIEALGQISVRSEIALNAVSARLQDPQEHQQVRLAAAQVLENIPMDDPTYAAYIAFKATTDHGKSDPF